MTEDEFLAALRAINAEENARVFGLRLTEILRSEALCAYMHNSQIAKEVDLAFSRLKHEGFLDDAEPPMVCGERHMFRHARELGPAPPPTAKDERGVPDRE